MLLAAKNDTGAVLARIVAIPEFQGLGTTVGQNIAAALSGADSVSDALKKSEATATATMTKAGYIK